MTTLLLIVSMVFNLVLAARLRQIRAEAQRIIRKPETCTLIAEGLMFLGELAGKSIFAMDPIGLRRKVIIERDGTTEVFVELPRSNDPR